MAGTGQRARIAAKWPRLRGAEGVAIAEFAVSLPLLLVIAVGIFDFGGAFNVKQKLDNAVRGARATDRSCLSMICRTQPRRPRRRPSMRFEM